MDAINALINSIAGSLGSQVVNLLGALLLLIVIWVVARVVKAAVAKLCARLNVDGKLKSPGLSDTFVNVSYWLVWLLALPMLLTQLGLTGMLEPVNNLVGSILGFVPKLAGSAIILGIGYLIANIVRQVVTGLLSAAGSEKLAERLNMSNSLGKGGLSGLIGTILFVLIMLPVVAGALQPLGLDSVTRPVTNMLDTIMSLLPRLFGAGIILTFALVVGRVIANIVSTILASVGFNSVLPRLGLGNSPKIAGRTPAELIGTLILAAIVIGALTQASEVLGFAALTSAVGTFGSIAAQVGAGVVVLAIGLWLSNLAANAIKGTTIANAGTLAMAARFAVLFFTIPMALRQMGLPAEIITVGFGSLLGALTIAAAIAFGIGGRHAAARIADDVVKNLNSGDR
jgi:hypothetical protein